MEFWPRKKGPQERAKPLVLEDTFDPAGFSDHENALVEREFDHIETPEAFMHSVDFEVMNIIFDDLTARSSGDGPVSTTGHRVSADRITFKSLEAGRDVTLGSANVQEGRITLMWDETPAQGPVPRALRMLHTLMHEATHVRGGYAEEHYKENGSIEEGTFSYQTTVRKGFREWNLKSPLGAESYTHEGGLSLNEAVTENIAQEVFDAYLVRTGNTGYLKDLSVRAELGSGSYIVDRLALALVIHALAQTLETDIDTVWRGFVQGYMSGSVDLKALVTELNNHLDSPRLYDVVYLLGEEWELDTRYSITDLINRIPGFAERLEVMDSIIQRVDRTRFSNALGLK